MFCVNTLYKRKKIIIISSIFIGQIILFSLLFSFQAVNNFIINYINFPISKLISNISNVVILPFGEFFYAFIGIIFLTFLTLILKSIFINRKNLIKRIYQFLVFLNVIYFIYMLSWGVMYKKETLSFDKSKLVIETKVLKEIYCSDLEKAIEVRKLISENDSMTTVKFTSNLDDYNKEFLKLQYQLKNEKWLKNYHFLKNPHYKLSFISSIQNHLGILGYYNPFTVEANLNKFNTDLKQPSTLFHEYGHQMGFASESEANFLAYYLGTYSQNPDVRYSIYYKSIFSLLRAIYRSDPYFVKMELDNMYPQITIDRKAEINHYSKYDGKSSEVFSELNNQFLKANNDEGTISYSNYIQLVYYLYQTKKAKPN
ncbi:DUF3810 family protein [Chishuiella changwenlii]|uniref:DUF3810 family protein n=1 Tax=Chishuiella changwenlii TaxID=1434701 RepID=UPI002FDAE7CF